MARSDRTDKSVVTFSSDMNRKVSIRNTVSAPPSGFSGAMRSFWRKTKGLFGWIEMIIPDGRGNYTYVHGRKT